ncbi:hypothetical protein DL762_000832 [Monosporascus cannonballus]|uniref:NADH:flavin oxidoreductase/NADH oxidase N-terminal domain-containing protein n=1 Tax=Monosporascus cannonballus TaxID=155416 RepID=A0ABY0HJE9_9PEZI|nr:hypothetical protein DL762_000832 [Monosporascus cannonballus]
MTVRRHTGAEPVDPTPLGEPLHFAFSSKTAPTRFLKAALSERLSSWHPSDLSKRGVPSKELINVYRRWGEGGFGVILTGNTMIAPDQLEAPGCLVIPRDAPIEEGDERFQRFRELAAAAKAKGSLVYLQVSHPGRQVPENIQPHPISASDVQLEGSVMGLTFAKPRAMEKADIDAVVDGFAHTAQYAHRAGFDGVQLHGAHGYLLAQFLSPTTNKRTDEYGGASVLNRGRLIFEIASEIRRRVADEKFSLAIKLNSVEFQDAGFTPEDCRDLCAELEAHGFDFVELSGGTYQSLAFTHRRESTRKREAYFIEFAEMVVPRLKKTKTYVTGGLRTVGAMVEALKTVDGVGLGRPICHEFDLPRKNLEDKVQGAVAILLDEDSFTATNVAAGTQMRLVGQDKQPLDLTGEDHLQAFQNSMGLWAQKMAADKDGSMYGFVDIEGIKLEPYGAAYSAA